MEQTTQQITQKPSLPIKTKIAAWLIIIVGGILLIQIARSIWYYRDQLYSVFDFIAENLFTAILIFVPGIFILFRKKSAWWVLRIFLWVVFIVGVISFISFFIINIPLDMSAIEGVTTDGIDMLVPVTLSLKLIKLGLPILLIQLVTHIIPLLIIFIPIILLELDRKNFNSIAKDTYLPLKTEVAYLLIGIDLFFLFIYSLFNLLSIPEYGGVFEYVIFFIATSAIFLPLLKRKEWAWKVSIIITCLLLSFYMFLLISNGMVYVIDILLLFLLTFPSLILIILDRKNFFKITS